ncbi:replication factor C large subunit [Caldivirga sp.]|uniref:replication factor C large subunit n=1 Tax=Caldivirga sp. TaxID=2080243 RepID=UPI0025C4F8D3|nr:replication factor C large subunit [Caldivirga sp.]
MSTRRLPWFEKYRPRSLKDVVDQEEVKKTMEDWVSRWLSGKEKRAILLSGPPGTGKTTMVHALAHDYGLELYEMNASDVRTASRIRETIGKALTQGSLFGFRGKLVLFDEVDGINVKADQGGIYEIVDIVKEAKVPIAMTANDPWDPKLRPLRDICIVVQVKPLKNRDIIEMLKRICSAEKVKCEEDALRLIAESSMGDMRSAINDLQTVAETGPVTRDRVSLLSSRAHQYDMFRMVDMVLKANTVASATGVTRLPSFDWESFLLWLVENAAVAYSSSPVAMSDAYDNLSKADVLKGIMSSRQEWELMPYVLELMTTGVALVRDKPKLPFFIRGMRFPEKIRLLARTREIRDTRDHVMHVLRVQLHESTATIIRDYLPLIRTLVESNGRVIEVLAKSLGVSERSIKLVISPEASEGQE